MLGHSIQLGSGSSEHGTLQDSVWVTAYEAGPGRGNNDPGSGWWPVLHGPTFPRLATQESIIPSRRCELQLSNVSRPMVLFSPNKPAGAALNQGRRGGCPGFACDINDTYRHARPRTLLSVYLLSLQQAHAVGTKVKSI